MSIVAVIGGSGRTGRHIVDQLQRDSSHAVRVLSRHGGGTGVETITVIAAAPRAPTWLPWLSPRWRRRARAARRSTA
jgi:nucleoside-diphosphate-sugar epimerase